MDITDVVVEAKADAKRPYKMYAAIASAFIMSYLSTSIGTLPGWAVGLLTATVAGLAVYITGNPINVKKSRIVTPRGGDNDPALFD